MTGNYENINIRLSASGALTVRRDLTSVGTAARSTGAAINSLKNTLRTLFSGYVIKQIINYADGWIQADNKIRVFTASAKEAELVHLKLFEAAQRTRQAINPLTTLYSRVAQAAGSLGASQNQAILFTENIAKMLLIQGVSANEARGAMIQLGQAMGMAKLRAQEFNSINEQVPIILQTVAKHLYGAKGSVAQLRAEMSAGKVTSRDLYKAVLDATSELDAKVADTSQTIGQAFTKLQNATQRQIGLFMKHSGVTDKLTKALDYLTDNIDTVIKVLAGLAPAFVIAFAPGIVSLISSITRGVWLLNAAIASNPLGALAVAISAVIGLLYAFKDDIVVYTTDISNLNEEFRKFNEIGDLKKDVKIEVTLADYINGVGDAWEEVNGEWDWNKYFEDSFSQINASLEMFGRDSVREINGIVKAFRLAGADIEYYWQYTNLKLNDYFTYFINSCIADLNLLIQGFNSLAGLTGFTISEIEYRPGDFTPFYDKLKSEYEAKKKYIEDNPIDITVTINDIFQEDTNGGEGPIDKLNRYAEQAAAKRKLRELKEQKKLESAVNDLNTPPLPTNIPNNDKSSRSGLNSLERQLKALMNTLDPVNGALLEMQMNVKLLDKATAAGLITNEKNKELQQTMTNIYKERIDPVGAYIDQLKRERQGNEAVSFQEQIRYRINEKLRELKLKNISVNNEQLKQIEDEIKKTVLLTSYYAKLKTLYESSPEFLMQQQANDFSALNAALDKGYISAQQYSNGLANIAIALGKLKINSEELTATDFFSGAMENVLQGYTTALAGCQEATGQFVASFVDGFSNAFASAIVKGDDLIDTLRNISQTILTQLISSLIKLGVQYLINAALAETVGAATTASSIAQAQTVASSWSSAAAMVSLASYGANSVPAMAAIGTTVAFSKSAALPGFETGGWTGDGNIHDVAGVVHGKEFVFDAESTRRIGKENLEALRIGKMQANEIASSKASLNSNQQANVVNENNVRVVNVLDKSELINFMNSSDGEKTIINIIKSNRNKLKNDY